MNCTKKDFKILLMLAVPLVLTGMIESAVPFISSIFLSHLGPNYLAAGALVAWFFATLMIVLWGVISAVSVLVAHKDGAKDTTGIAFVLRDGMWLALIMVIPTTLLIWNMSPILYLFGQSHALVDKAIPYMHALAWGILPDFIGLVLLQFIIGLGQTRTNLVFTIAWVPINIFLNYILVYGKFGFPALGIAGLGWGTTLSYWVTSIGLLSYMLLRKYYRQYFWTLKLFVKSQFIGELIKVGLPMGLMWFVEISFFFALSLLMGHFGVKQLAANQIVIQYVGFFVSIVFSMAQAVTVRMSNQIGAQKFASAKRAALAGIVIAFILTFVVVLFELFMPHLLIGIDFHTGVKTAVIISLAIKFFAIATIFQLAESVRITLFGALRSLKDTKFTLFTSFIAFWCLAIPLGFLINHIFNIGAEAYWYGLALSAILNTLLLYWRYTYKIRAFVEQQNAN